MLAHLLAMAGTAPQGQQPTLSGLTLTPSGGACLGGVTSQQATIRLDWSIAGPNDTSYQTQISVNGGSPIILGSTSTTTYTFTIPGGVTTSGNHLASQRTDSFEVRLVRKADSVVVQTLSGSYSDMYGGCGGPQ